MNCALTCLNKSLDNLTDVASLSLVNILILDNGAFELDRAEHAAVLNEPQSQSPVEEEIQQSHNGTDQDATE